MRIKLTSTAVIFFKLFLRSVFARLPHMKCIRLDYMRSSHLPFKMHDVRSSPHVFVPKGE